jgi:hypothetical protein
MTQEIFAAAATTALVNPSSPARRAAPRPAPRQWLAVGCLALLLGAAAPVHAKSEPCPSMPEWDWDEPEAVNPGLGTW